MKCKKINYKTIYQCNNCNSIFAIEGTKEMLECIQCEEKNYSFVVLSLEKFKKFSKLYHKYREKFDAKESFKRTAKNLKQLNKTERKILNKHYKRCKFRIK